MGSILVQQTPYQIMVFRSPSNILENIVVGVWSNQVFVRSEEKIKFW